MSFQSADSSGVVITSLYRSAVYSAAGERERERRDDKCVGLFEKRTEITVSIDEEHLHKCRCNQKRRRTLGPSQKAVGGGRQRRSHVSIHTKSESFLFGFSGGEAAAALSAEKV